MIIRTILVSSVVLASLAAFAAAQTPPTSGVSASPVQTGEQKPAYATAKPFALPIAEGYTDERARRALAGIESTSAPTGVFEKGALGTGKRDPKPLHTPVSKEGENLPNLPQIADFGTAGRPFSTARGDLTPAATNDQFPYSAAGKLFFNEGGQTFICSASTTLFMGGPASFSHNSMLTLKFCRAVCALASDAATEIPVAAIAKDKRAADEARGI